jgi:RNA polymerase sigma factor for flagellar operon FliA
MTPAAPPVLGNEDDSPFVRSLAAIEEVVAHVCRRQRCTPDEQEDFAALVRLKLLEKDCAVLREFAGRSSLRTYLGVVVERLFIDHRRSLWGIWRPSARARRLGPVAVRLDVLVHRDGVRLDEAVERLRRNEGVDASEAELRALFAQLPAHAPRRMTGEEALADLQVSPETAVERPALAYEREERASALLGALRDALSSLPAEDALVIRLRFCEGLDVRRIADWLKLPPKPLYRRLERLLRGLRAELEARGFLRAELGALLGDEAVEQAPPPPLWSDRLEAQDVRPRLTQESGT